MEDTNAEQGGGSRNITTTTTNNGGGGGGRGALLELEIEQLHELGSNTNCLVHVSTTTTTNGGRGRDGGGDPTTTINQDAAMMMMDLQFDLERIARRLEVDSASGLLEEVVGFSFHGEDLTRMMMMMDIDENVETQILIHHVKERLLPLLLQPQYLPNVTSLTITGCALYKAPNLLQELEIFEVWRRNNLHAQIQELCIQNYATISGNFILPIKTLQEIGRVFHNLHSLQLIGSTSASEVGYPFWSTKHSEALADSLEKLSNISLLRNVTIQHLVMHNPKESLEPLVVALGKQQSSSPSSSLFRVEIEDIQEFLGMDPARPINDRERRRVRGGELIRDYNKEEDWDHELLHALEYGPTIQQTIRRAKRKGVLGNGSFFLHHDWNRWIDIMAKTHRHPLEDDLDLFYLLCLEVFQTVGNASDVQEICQELVQRIIDVSSSSSPSSF